VIPHRRELLLGKWLGHVGLSVLYIVGMYEPDRPFALGPIWLCGAVLMLPESI
jgi:hypothetical protein